MSTLRIDVDVTPILEGGACGGAKPFVLDLLRGLATAPRPHHYRLLTAAHNHEAFEEFERLGMTRQRADHPDAPLRLKDAGTHVLFCPMTAPTYAEPGVRTVSILYDLQHEAYPLFFDDAELAHRRRFYRDLARRVDHIVCISEFSRISLIRRLGVAPERTSVVPIAIQRRLSPLNADQAWTQLGAALPRCRFAFYPANFWPHKNHRMLLVAFARFLKDHPDSDLHLVLTGELLLEGEPFKRAVERMGLSSRVHVLGFVSEDRLAALWSAAFCLVFPSLFEGFGIPIVEAMHFGKPILSSRETSLPEVAGEEAFYFDPRNPGTMADALARVTAESAHLDERIERARMRLEHYRPAVIVEQYLDVMERAAAGGARRSAAETPERNGDGHLLTPLTAYIRYLEDWRASPDSGSTAAPDGAVSLKQYRELEARLNDSEADRAARLELIERQGAELGRVPALEADVEFLKTQIRQSEADRAARLEIIEQQGAELGLLQKELWRRSGWRRLWPWA